MYVPPTPKRNVPYLGITFENKFLETCLASLSSMLGKYRKTKDGKQIDDTTMTRKGKKESDNKKIIGKKDLQDLP